jgi:hypothetical protein
LSGSTFGVDFGEIMGFVRGKKSNASAAPRMAMPADTTSAMSMPCTKAETELAERLDEAISDIDDTIGQFRSSIFELGSDESGIRASFRW